MAEKGVKVGSRVWTLVVQEVAVASPSFGFNDACQSRDWGCNVEA